MACGRGLCPDNLESDGTSVGRVYLVTLAWQVYKCVSWAASIAVLGCMQPIGCMPVPVSNASLQQKEEIRWSGH